MTTISSVLPPPDTQIKLTAKKGPLGCIDVDGRKIWITKMTHKDFGPGQVAKDLDLSKPDPAMLAELEKATKIYQAHIDSLSPSDKQKFLKKIDEGKNVTFKCTRNFQQYGTIGDYLRLPLTVLPHLFFGSAGRYIVDKNLGRGMGPMQLKEVVDDDDNEVFDVSSKSYRDKGQDLATHMDEIDYSHFDESIEPKAKKTKSTGSTSSTPLPVRAQERLRHVPYLQTFIQRNRGGGDCMLLSVAAGIMHQRTLPRQAQYRAELGADVEAIQRNLRVGIADTIRNTDEFGDPTNVALFASMREAMVSARRNGANFGNLNAILEIEATRLTLAQGQQLQAAYANYVNENGVNLDQPALVALAVMGIPVAVVESNGRNPAGHTVHYHPAGPDGAAPHNPENYIHIFYNGATHYEYLDPTDGALWETLEYPPPLSPLDD